MESAFCSFIKASQKLLIMQFWCFGWFFCCFKTARERCNLCCSKIVVTANICTFIDPDIVEWVTPPLVGKLVWSICVTVLPSGEFHISLWGKQGCEFSLISFVGVNISFPLMVQIFAFLSYFQPVVGLYNPNLSTFPLFSFLLAKCYWYPWWKEWWANHKGK